MRMVSTGGPGANEVKLKMGGVMFDKLRFVEVSASRPVEKTDDKLQFVGPGLT